MSVGLVFETDQTLEAIGATPAILSKPNWQRTKLAFSIKLHCQIFVRHLCARHSDQGSLSDALSTGAVVIVQVVRQPADTAAISQYSSTSRMARQLRSPSPTSRSRSPHPSTLSFAISICSDVSRHSSSSRAASQLRPSQSSSYSAAPRIQSIVSLA
jgi:hypothetical protein